MDKKPNGKNKADINELRYVTKKGDFAERRRAARLDVPIKVYYKVLKGKKDFQKAVTKNVSGVGCLLLTTDKVPVNSEVGLQVVMGKSEKDFLTLQGTIVRLNRKQRGLYEFGISFKPLSAEARRVFTDYFFSKMYEMFGLSRSPTGKK